ncbi:MAG: ABC transporter permease, partial [Deltaproteobacteria bacterium]|nr:ABC transporter permease [Deltaproteobacteria bacterium]
MLLRYILQRIWQLVPVLVLVSMAVFLIVRLIPGDPVLVMMGVDPEERTRISEAQYQVMQQQLGLDRPIYVQYANWLSRIVQGDMGLSLRSRRPIFEVIFERYPATIYLAVISLVVGVLIALPAGVIAAIKQNTGA